MGSYSPLCGPGCPNITQYSYRTVPLDQIALGQNFGTTAVSLIAHLIENRLNFRQTASKSFLKLRRSPRHARELGLANSTGAWNFNLSLAQSSEIPCISLIDEDYFDRTRALGNGIHVRPEDCGFVSRKLARVDRKLAAHQNDRH